MTDEDAIVAVLQRYATGIDRRDWELFRTCFTADVRAEYGAIGTWSGVDEITGFMVEAHLGFGHTMHRLSNLVVAVQGERATARSYVHALLMSPDGTAGVESFGFYDDDLVRTDDGWRIARRRFTDVHTRGI